PVPDPPADAERVLRSLETEAIPTYAVTTGHLLVWGDGGQVSARAVWPPTDRVAGRGLGANNGSVVLDVTAEDVRMLFTGDIEPEAARGIRRELAGERFDVLKVAHHGSAAQDASLVTGLGARAALIGRGPANSFGHPSRPLPGPL